MLFVLRTVSFDQWVEDIQKLLWCVCVNCMHWALLNLATNKAVCGLCAIHLTRLSFYSAVCESVVCGFISHIEALCFVWNMSYSLYHSIIFQEIVYVSGK